MMGLIKKTLIGAALAGGLWYAGSPNSEVIHEYETIRFDGKTRMIKDGHANPTKIEFTKYDTSNGSYAIIRHEKTNRAYIIEEDDDTLYINTFPDVIKRTVNNIADRFDSRPAAQIQNREPQEDISNWVGGSNHEK